MIPMQPNPDFHLADASDPKLPFRELIGSLLFLSRTTRPDIGFAVGKLSQFCGGFDETHWKLAKAVARYLKETIGFGLEFKANCSTTLIGYTDADYAGDRQDRKSTTGMAFFLGTSLVSWASRKQPVVAMSSTEAEYVALAVGAKEAVWLRNFSEELNIPQTIPTKIMVDNQSSIKLARNPEFHERSKHIDVRFHFTRGLIKNGTLNVTYVPTEQQVADIFTKPLAKHKFQEMRHSLGIKNFQSSADLCQNDIKPEEVKKKAGISRHSLLSMMMLFFLILRSGSGFQIAQPLLWQPSSTPVTKGNYRVMLTIKFVKPCKIFTEDIIHRDMLTEAKEQCEKMYQDLFVNELQKMCQTESQRTVLMRSKRFIISLTIGLIVATVIAAIGVTATTVAVTNTVRISSLNSVIEEQARKAEELKERMEIAETLIRNIKDDLNNIVHKLEEHEDDINELKKKYVSSNFIISYLTTKLMLAKEIIKETHRQMQVEKIHPAFLDYFNFSLPCAEDCPLPIATFRKCFLTPDADDFYLDFDIPLVNRSLQLVESDTFELMIKKDNQTCRVAYTGPKSAIISKEDGCVTGINIKPNASHNAILSPTSGCLSPSKLPDESKYFSIDSCEVSHPEDEQQFVQVKPYFGSNYVYCAGSSVEIDGKTEQCPDSVFVLPITATFQINDMKLIGTSFHLTHQETQDPLFTLKTNWHLKPKVNLTHLLSKSKFGQKQKTEMSIIEHTMTWTSIAFTIISILLASLVIYMCIRDRKVTVSVIAEHDTPQEVIEMEEVRTRD